MSIETESSLRRDSFKNLYRQSSADEFDGRFSVSSQDERYQDSVSSAFAKERLRDVCDCNIAEEGHDAVKSDLSQNQCRQTCQELPILETIDVSVTDGEPSHRSRINSCPKYLMTKGDRSPDNSKKRKYIQWRPRTSDETLKFRRRTTDSIPTVNTILVPTRSSPNLSNLEEQMKTALNVKADPFCKQEENSKL